MKEAALLEMLRLVREEEPPRPSTRLSHDRRAADASRPTAATEPRKLTGLVRGELDWIVMKALEKDRTRRYETANGFAADVQRYLAGEPVQAVPAVGRLPAAEVRPAEPAGGPDGVGGRRGGGTGPGGLVVGKLLFEQAELKAARDLATASAEARSRLEARLYRQRIALAEREWSANNLSRMEALLEQCPADLRGWEWHYLKRLRHSVQSPLRHESPVLDVAFSPDGQHLATGTQAGVVRIWQAKPARNSWNGKATTAMSPTVRFSPDGRYLATGSWDNT